MKKKKNEITPPAALPASEMTDGEMETLLLEFADTRFFQAYARYIGIRMGLAEQALFSLDPFKQPTETARNQGIRFGLMDLDGYIIELKRVRAEREKQTNA